VTERAIELRWEAPTDTTSGTPLEGIASYEVYRSPSGGPGSFVLHGTAATSRYEDTQFAFGQSYFYRVRTVAQFGSDTVESENSPAVEVEARDVFPPPAPANLIAVAGEGRVDLTWDASRADDLAGYVVYRSRQPGRGFQRLNRQPLAAQSFTDRLELEPGVSYYYLVTAVDAEGNESGYSEEVLATPRATE
jgi:fibronectin type 3 domain-containing protein